MTIHFDVGPVPMGAHPLARSTARPTYAALSSCPPTSFTVS